MHATAARRDGDNYVLVVGNGREVRGDRLLVATGRRPRVEGLGLETVGVKADAHGIPVDAHLRAGERLWAIGDVTGVRLLTHMGKYQGEVVAANILGEPREANYQAVPDVVYTYALGPEAGEWLQQATLAIRARVPLQVLRDVIQPFPTFSEIYVGALKALHGEITAARQSAEGKATG